MRRFSIATGLVVLLAASSASANPYLDKGRAAYDALNFDAAIPQLELARKSPSASTEERVQALDLLARSYIAVGRRDDAELSYGELCALDPEFEPPQGTSPKISDAFLAAKRSIYPPDFVQLVELPAAPGFVRLELRDPWHRVARVTFETRVAGQPASETRGRERVLRFASPEQVPSPWWAAALAEDGTTLARVGTTQSPREVPAANAMAVDASASKPQSAPRHLAAWVASAATVALAGAGTYFALHGASLDAAARDRSAPPGDWADTARAAHASAQQSVNLAFVCGGAAVATGVFAGVAFTW